MTYRYKVGYGTYEESHYWEFSHEKRFSEEEIEEAVAKAIIGVLEHLLKNEDKYFYWGQVECGPPLQECMVADRFTEEMKLQGFRPVEYTATWSGFGWDGVIKTHWNDAENEGLRSKIPEGLKKRVLAKTKKEEEESELRISKLMADRKKIEKKEEEVQ